MKNIPEYNFFDLFRWIELEDSLGGPYISKLSEAEEVGLL